MKGLVLPLVEFRMLAFLFLQTAVGIGVLTRRRSVDEWQILLVGLRDNHLRELDGLEADGIRWPALEICEKIVDEFVETMLVLLCYEVLLLGNFDHMIHCLTKLLALKTISLNIVVDCSVLAVFFRRSSQFFREVFVAALDEGKNDCERLIGLRGWDILSGVLSDRDRVESFHFALSCLLYRQIFGNLIAYLPDLVLKVFFFFLF